MPNLLLLNVIPQKSNPEGKPEVMEDRTPSPVMELALCAFYAVGVAIFIAEDVSRLWLVLAVSAVSLGVLVVRIWRRDS